jgi:AraC-like DNA-binding protein
MKDSPRNSKKSYFKLQSDAGGLIQRLRTRFLPDGTYLFEDQLDVTGVLAARVITCAAWLLEIYELKAGELSFLSAATPVLTRGRCFGVFYPPFTIAQPRFKNVKARLIGVAGTAGLPPSCPRIPVRFETFLSQLPQSATQALEIVTLGERPQSVEMNPKPSLLSLKAKRLIDENYLSFPSIARVAGRLGVTHEHLSRQFKRDFEISPGAYLHQLRLADAPLRLARGEEIINVSQDVGYNDLSRFYKQFRKTTKTSPGVCQALMKPNRA